MSRYTKHYEKALKDLPPIYAFLIQDGVDRAERYNVLPTSSPPPKGGWVKLLEAVKSGATVMPKFDAKAPKQTEALAKSIIQVLPGGTELLKNEDCSFSGMGLAYIGGSNYSIIFKANLTTVQQISENLLEIFTLKTFSTFPPAARRNKPIEVVRQETLEYIRQENPDWERLVIDEFKTSVADPDFIKALQSIWSATCHRLAKSSKNVTKDTGDAYRHLLLKALASPKAKKKDSDLIKNFLAPLSDGDKKIIQKTKAANRQRKTSKQNTQKEDAVPDRLIKYWLPLVLWKKTTSQIVDALTPPSLKLEKDSPVSESTIRSAVSRLNLYRKKTA